jgi:transcriptional regulator with GAF, ATPase, and Fis domain/serine/threonine protein kinase
LSSNSLSSSWIAGRKSDGSKCFLKTLAPSNDLTSEAQRSVLARSWSLQQKIRTGSILASRKKARDGEQLVIEYPLLESPRWLTLTPKIILEFLPSVLGQVFSAAEYLHCLGLVHCDLKLDNFLYCSTTDGVRLVLTDLDFLCSAGATPDAKIFGTPDHIAPEILSGSHVDVASDNYSLGVSIRKLVEYCRANNLDSESGTLAKLDKLAAGLSVDDIHSRSGPLLGALLDAAIISEKEHARLLKSSLIRHLFGTLRPYGSGQIAKSDAVSAALRSCRVLGVSDELAKSLDELNTQSFTKCLRVLRTLVEASGIERQGEHWLISSEESVLRNTYESVDADLAGRSASEPPASTSRSLELVKTLEAEARYERAFLMLRAIHSTNPIPQHFLPLAALASRLSKPDLAIRYLKAHLDQATPLTTDDVPEIHRLAKELLGQGRLEEAQEWVAQGTELSVKKECDPYALKLTIQRAWLAGCRGEYDSARDTLREVYEAARNHKVDDEEISAAYCLGVMNWRQGRLMQSEKWLLRAHKKLTQSGRDTHVVPVNAALAMVCQETAQYHRAERYARVAIGSALEPQDRSSLPPVYLNLVASLARLGEFNRAQYWIQACAHVVGGKLSANRHLSYYLTKGWLELTMCNLTEARLSLERALLYDCDDVSQRSLGKVHQNLADICLMQGDLEGFEQDMARATELFESSNDVHEIEFMGLLSQATYSNIFKWRDWFKSCASLISCRQYYTASVCMLYLYLHADAETLERVVGLVGSLADLARKSKAPLMEAIRVLDCAAKNSDGEWPPPPAVLKKVYRLLETGGHRFHGIAVCLKVARIYRDAGNVRLARKFLCQAQSIARSLSNKAMSDRIAEEIRQTDQSTDLRESLMASFEGISQVLHKIKDRTLALNRLVEFAVEETGAERGVLLLKKGEAGQLRTEAQFACDENSIRDIERISSSLPSRALEASDTLIVDHAVQDDRTRGLKSIIRHNILSVVCTPIYRKGEAVGVLYLDHHTIPALFDTSDLAFIRAITNFISVTLAVADDFKNMLVSNQELTESRQRHGGSKVFVSDDPAIKAIFAQIPRIARSSASVLLIGESGTGKEIIGQIIHGKSHRSNRAFVRFNSSAVASSLVEAELFGVAPNTATNVEGRDGKLSAADDGTLFVDEVGDMSLEVQAKILRAVEYQHFERVGSNRTLYTDIRFIYATNRDLKSMIAKGQFRPDLLYRINTITIEIPPLRQRRGDIPLLLGHFQRLFDESGQPVSFASDAMDALIEYSWPGNVRELMNLVERYSIVYPGSVISYGMLPKEIRDGSHDAPSQVGDQVQEAKTLRRALISCDWNQTRAAGKLGIPRTTLSRKMKTHGLRK